MRRQLSQRTMIWSMALGGLLLLILSGQAATPVFADAMDSYDEWNGKDPCTGTGIYPLLQPFFASFKTLSEPYNTNIDRFAAPEVTTTTPGNNRWSRGDVQVHVKAMYCGNSAKVGAYKVRAEITGAEARTAQFTNTWQNPAYSCDLTHPCRAMKVTLDVTAEGISTIDYFITPGTASVEPARTLPVGPEAHPYYPLGLSCPYCVPGTGYRPIVVKIDKTAPTVAVTRVQNGATYTLGAVPAPGCATTDNVSGVAQSATVVLSGGNPDGTGTFTATCAGATDVAGNVRDRVQAVYSVVK